MRFDGSEGIRVRAAGQAQPLPTAPTPSPSPSPPPTEDAHCPSLPSSTTAYALVRGDLGALPAVLGSMVLRAGLIAGGLYLADPNDKHLAKKALYGAAAIEVFVLGWVAWKSRPPRG